LFLLWLGAAMSMSLISTAPVVAGIGMFAFGGTFMAGAVVLNVRDRVVRQTPTVVVHPVQVGRDGALLPSGFVHVSEIESVQKKGAVCVLTMIDGRRLELQGTPAEVARVKDLAVLIANEPPETLDEDGERYVADLAGAAPSDRAGGAYRGLALDPSRFVAIASDFRAPPAVRIAAASMAAGALDTEMRERLADAAESSVHPEVRVALRAAAAV
jgi:hypothetical protein